MSLQNTTANAALQIQDSQQEMRSQVAHSVSVPLNPALQLLDAVTLVDSAAPSGSGQSSICRIARVLAHFDAQHGLYDLQLQLEGL